MTTCWLKTPVKPPGQLLELTDMLDGAIFTSGFAVAKRRKQDVVLGPLPTRIEGSPGQRNPRRETKPADKLDKRIGVEARYQRVKEKEQKATMIRIVFNRRPAEQVKVLGRGTYGGGDPVMGVAYPRLRFTRLACGETHSILLSSHGHGPTWVAEIRG